MKIYLEKEKEKKVNIFIILIKFCALFIDLISIFTLIKNRHFLNNNKSINKININKYLNNNNFSNLKTLDYFNYYYYNITYFNYSFSLKYNITKVIYNIGFYDYNNNLIIPSNLPLYDNLHIICHININNKDFFDSLAEIYLNNYFKCIEFIDIKENINFGIKIIKDNNSYVNFFFDKKIIDYNNLHHMNDYNVEPLIINNEYNLLKNQINTTKYEKKYLIKKSFIKPPICSSINNLIIEDNNWYFTNLFNDYFYFCKGKECLYKKIVQKYKYNFYLNIIDKNRYIYNKTDYLFSDFIKKYSSHDDTYPVFMEMIKLKQPAHYMTVSRDLYKLYCNGIKHCISIILMSKDKKTIDGDFLEKYLTLFLKLKAAISGATFFYIDNLFYNIDYITHICVGHGVSIIKDFLYNANSYYGYNKYNKILLPPSNEIISIAKKRGWKDENIIKINLPRWDKYNKNKYSFERQGIKENSIYIMFTWRQIKKNQTISKYYLKNIIKLISDNRLIHNLNEKNVTLYFTLHHKFRKYINFFKRNTFFEYIVENKISECLTKSQLVITDFSSIIFDFICRKKPYIIFIPEAYDPQIKNIYVKKYYNIIKRFKNNSLNYENKFFEVNKAINKIIYYINNNFILEKKLEQFYKKFSFKSGNNIKDFIKYLNDLK